MPAAGVRFPPAYYDPARRPIGPPEELALHSRCRSSPPELSAGGDRGPGGPVMATLFNRSPMVQQALRRSAAIHTLFHSRGGGGFRSSVGRAASFYSPVTIRRARTWYRLGSGAKRAARIRRLHFWPPRGALVAVGRRSDRMAVIAQEMPV